MCRISNQLADKNINLEEKVFTLIMKIFVLLEKKSDKNYRRIINFIIDMMKSALFEIANNSLLRKIK